MDAGTPHVGSPTSPAGAAPSRVPLLVAVVASGAAGLTWETMWQARAALALGISTYGAAMTLAGTMLGLALGATAMGRWLARGRVARPLFAYGIAELVVAAAGLATAPFLAAVAAIDTASFATSPDLAVAISLVGTAIPIVVASSAMGATLPLLAAVASERGTRIATLYALNTAGAVVGVLVVTFVLLPGMGLRNTELVAAALDVAVAIWAITARGAPLTTPSASPEKTGESRVRSRALAVAFASGFTVFVLEVSWFRSIRAAYQSTTESFAIVLAAFLFALALGAAIARPLRRVAPNALAFVLAISAAGIFVATPIVDALDAWVATDIGGLDVQATRFLHLLAIVGGPIAAQGIALPWLLDETPDPRATARLYAVNTMGAVTGGLFAGFVALPWVGATTTSWIAVAPIALGALVLAPSHLARFGLVVAAVGVAVAGVHLHGGSARDRVQGFAPDQYRGVLYVREDPDSTVWVTTSSRERRRKLVIDGFVASGEGEGEHYMSWMGTLPALATPVLRRALVICFGTGQTANAVRDQRPAALDIADISRAVLDAAPLFPSNHGVLRDRRVSAVVMDGRAWLRRAADRRYDAITMEPMPPNFAGTNALYSRELYALARARLAPRGVMAQWVPFHLIAPDDMRAIVATFHEAFPHTRLWIDPVGLTGILVGSARPFALRPSHVPLDLDARRVADAFALDAAGVARLARGAAIITDDDQLLAYGTSRLERHRDDPRWFRRLQRENLALVRAARARASAQTE